MYRQLLSTIRQLLTQWRKRPFGAVLLLMVIFTAIGGPAVCLLDCWLHDLRAAQSDPQSLHLHHSVVDGSATAAQDTSGTRHEQHHTDGDGHTPGALTIAVVLMIALLLPLHWVRHRLYEIRHFVASLALPPPPRPPRLSLSFVLEQPTGC